MIEKEKLIHVLEQSLSPLAILEGPDHIFKYMNSKFTELLLGGRDILGRPHREALPEAVEQGFGDLLDHVYRTGQTYYGKEVTVLLEQPDQTNRRFVLNFTYAPLRNRAQQIEGILVAAVDVTDSVRAREHMRDSRERYRILTNLSPQFVWETRADGYVTFINQFWLDYTGLTFAASEGDGWAAAIHPEHRARVMEAWMQALKNNDTYEIEVPYRRFDGVYRWHLSKGQPILALDGTVERWVGVSVDIHDKRVRTSRLQSVIDTIPIFTGVLNAAGEVVLINGLALKSINSTLKREIGRPFWEISWWWGLPDMEAKLRTALARAHAGHSSRFDAPYRTVSEGSVQERYVDFSMVPIIDEDGGVTEITVTGFDITERIEQSRKFEAATKAAELANQAKSAFLANMSHEIRTPLGAIIGFTDLLRDRDLTSAERQQFIETIARNGRALTRIIDDILDLAKVESGKLEIEQLEFSFLELIDEVMDLFRERTRAKGIYLRAHLQKATPSRIISDPTRLRQILINIVGNAVKFTETGGVTIEVSSGSSVSDKSEFEIVVRDTGLGMTPSQSERLFEPFAQADNSTTRKFGGTGLGLALSRRLAVALGGDLAIIESEVGRGSAFQIRFLAKVLRALEGFGARPVQAKARPGGPETLDGVSVLLADDSEDNQYLVQRLLETNGASVDTADNGVEAFRKGMAGAYDVVLMDMQMPEMDGYESTRALREAGYKRPIIALTAHAMAEERARSFAAGCSGYLTKPLNPRELLETVRRMSGPL